MQVDAKSSQSLNPIRRICDLVLLIIFACMRRQGRQHRSLDLIARERAIADSDERTFHSHCGGRMRHQQQIAAVARDQLLKPRIELGRAGR
jgi:hypothetical protein